MIARFHYKDLIYRQLLRDELPSEQQEAVTAHIEQCTICQSKLEAMSQSSISWDEVHRYLDPRQRTEYLDSSDPDAKECSPSGSTSLAFLEPSNEENSLGRYGRYEITEVLGRGGMGVVLRGYDAALNRHSAIKVLTPELAANAAARQRFSREAKSAAAVVHEHVIPILTVDEEQGLPYLVMPVVEGRSLEQRVDEKGPLESKEILRIGMQIASGLAAAHAQGLVHRDVKPANILLENGVERVMITDFGLARAVDDASMTRSGVVTGTPQYMSPEQSRGNEVDCRSDLFSLGSVLYFMCTGHSPFRAETTMGVLHRIVNDEPRSVRFANPDVPAWLEEVILRLLEKDPDARYQTAEEVAEELGSWLAHLQQPEQFAPPRKQKTQASGFNSHRPSNRWAAWVGGMAFAFIALMIIVLEMNKGTIVIRSEKSNVSIRIKRGERIVKRIAVKHGKASTRIAAGEYVVEVDGQSDQIVINDRHVSLHRGEQEIVQITVKEAAGNRWKLDALDPEGNVELDEIDWGAAQPNMGAIAVKASTSDPNVYVQATRMVRAGDNAHSLTELEFAANGDEYQVFKGLTPGKYSVSLMKKAGPRHVRVGIYEVEISAGDRKKVEFPVAMGVSLRGRITGMQDRGLTSAAVMLHRKDDQWKSKSMKYIEADEAVGVEQDGEFETMPLAEGWYEWSLAAYAPDDGRRIGFRLPGYSLSGDVYVPAKGVAEEFEIVIPSNYVPNLERSQKLLSKPSSPKLAKAVEDIRTLLTEFDEEEFAAIVTKTGIREAVIRVIDEQRAQMVSPAENETEEKSRRYFVETVEPILLQVAGGDWPESCKLDVWYTGMQTKGRRIPMSISVDQSGNNLHLAEVGFRRDGIYLRIDVTTPKAISPGFGSGLIELKGGQTSSEHSVVNNVYVIPQGNKWNTSEEFFRSMSSTRLRSDLFLNRVAALNFSGARIIEECLSGLVVSIGDENPEVRRRAITALRYLKEMVDGDGDNDLARPLHDGVDDHLDDIVEALVDRLGDSDTKVVAASILALKSFGSSSQIALERLTELMGNDEYEYAAWAADAVGTIAPERTEVGPRLLELIKAKKPGWIDAARLLRNHVPADEAIRVLTASHTEATSETERKQLMDAIRSFQPQSKTLRAP